MIHFLHNIANYLTQQRLSDTHRCRVVANLFSVWLLVAFFCPPILAANSRINTDQPSAGYRPLQRQINQKNTKQRQELYRVHLAVPGANNPDVAQATSAKLIQHKPALPPPSAIADNPLMMFLLTGMVLLAGYACARKFSPQIFPSAWLNSDSFGEDATNEEQKLLSEFIQSFRARFATTPNETKAAADAMSAAEHTHRMFYSQAQERLVKMRRWLDELRRGPDKTTQRNALVSLASEYGALKIDAHFPEAQPVYQLTTAAQGLLRQLLQKPERLTQSTVRTVGGSLDMLERLCVPGTRPDLLTAEPLKFLVADDEVISLRAMSLAISKAFSKPDLAEDGLSALARANEDTYDVIFLDVNMPGMDGFELCSKIRTSERNRETPIIFVTSNSDFDSRAESILIGGNDLMAKPFLIFEIALKALTHAFEARLAANGKGAGPDDSAARTPAPATLPPDNGISRADAAISKPG